MKKNINIRTNRTLIADNNTQGFFFFFALSTIGHLIFFTVMLFAPGYSMHKKTSLSVINVNLVTLPELKKTSSTVKNRYVQPPDHKIVHQNTITSKQSPKILNKTLIRSPSAVSVKRTYKNKTSLKKKTFKSSKVVKSALKNIEKNVEKSRPDQVAQAIDRLKKKVSKPKNDFINSKKEMQNHGTGDISGEKTKRTLELIDLYRIEVAYQIQRNWAFPEQLAGETHTGLVAVLAFTIMPNGEIKDIWFDKRSGNRYLDESAKKAILKSNPVRPIPAKIRRPFITVGLRFTPKGIK